MTPRKKLPPRVPAMARSSKKRSTLRQQVGVWWEKPEEPMECKPLLSHLAALRKTLIVCVLAIFIAFLAVFLLYSKQLVAFVTEPLTNQNIQVVFTGVAEAFSAETKLSLIVGVVIASPVVLTAIWLFVRPALHRKERVFTALILMAAVLLFAAGVFFAYQYVFFLAVNFFVYAGETVASPMIALGTYVNFLFSFLIPFGIMFELPIFVVGLTKLGLVTTKDLKKARKFVFFAIFIVAAILTPPDVVSQLMLGIPMCVLYEVGVVCSWLFRTRTDPEEQTKKAAVKA